ncbi:MAG TPA: hypothetical protein VK906_11175 [Egicoccus sp.]|nr:hypothetical protein [Egicoccus sp.]HSK23732.1 hypothetical protein [Egicoccus sp.]
MTTPEATRLHDALELADFGIEVMRMNLRRRHPAETDEGIDRLLRDWLAGREPDSPGRVRPLTAT